MPIPVPLITRLVDNFGQDKKGFVLTQAAIQKNAAHPTLLMQTYNQNAAYIEEWAQYISLTRLIQDDGDNSVQVFFGGIAIGLLTGIAITYLIKR